MSNDHLPIKITMDGREVNPESLTAATITEHFYTMRLIAFAAFTFHFPDLNDQDRRSIYKQASPLIAKYIEATKPPQVIAFAVRNMWPEGLNGIQAKIELAWLENRLPVTPATREAKGEHYDKIRAVYQQHLDSLPNPAGQPIRLEAFYIRYLTYKPRWDEHMTAPIERFKRSWVKKRRAELKAALTALTEKLTQP